MNKINIDEVKQFIEFELSNAGQEIVKGMGFYPIDDGYKAKNNKNL